MKKKLLILNQKGFSLIELLVVVAIMGILVTIAVPSYNSFRTKAKKQEAAALLNAYFVSASAFRVESGTYTGDFAMIGFNPTGTLGYRITSTAVSASPGAPYCTGGTSTGCHTTENVKLDGTKKAHGTQVTIAGTPPVPSCAAQSAITGSQICWGEYAGQWVEKPDGSATGTLKEGPAAPVTCTAANTGGTFLVCASGVVELAKPSVNTWSVNENKQIVETNK